MSAYELSTTDYTLTCNDGTGTFTINANVVINGNTTTSGSSSNANPFFIAAANNTGSITDMGLLAQTGPTTYAGLRFDVTANTWQISPQVASTGIAIAPYENIALGTVIYGNANVASYLPTYTGNIAANNIAITTGLTSNIAVFTSLTVNANSNLANVTTANTTAGNLFTDGYYYANGTPVSFAGTYSNANVTTYLPTYTGNLSPGNILATNYLYANGTPINFNPYGDSNVSAYLASGTNTANIITTGNIQGSYILGNGALLTGLPQQYTNANVAAYLPTYTGNLVSLTGNVTTTANVNAAAATITGNTHVGNIFTNGYYYANGAAVVFGGSSNYSNANVQSYLPTYSGNLNSVENITISGVIVGNGSELTLINGANVSTVGNAIYATSAGSAGTAATAGTVTTGAQPNITSVGTLTTLNVSGNIYPGNILTDGYYYANGVPFTAGGGSGANVVVGDQQFEGDGNSAYTLSNTATNTSLLVTVNGLTQLPGNSYSVSGNIITFASPIYTGTSVDIRYLGIGSGSGNSNYGDANVIALLPNLTSNVTTTANVEASYFIGNGAFLTGIAGGANVVIGDQQFEGDGNTAYVLSNTATNNSLLVAVNGLIQSPANSYTVSGNTITFASAINTGTSVDIRYLGVGTSPTSANTAYSGANTTASVDFSTAASTSTLMYLPTGAVTINLTGYTAGSQAQVLVRLGTAYDINTGIANASQSTSGTTTISAAGLTNNTTVQLSYTCWDNTAANCYVVATYM